MPHNFAARKGFASPVQNVTDYSHVFHTIGKGGEALHLRICKSARQLTLWQEDRLILRCSVGLGRCPAGPKTREGDGCTPEGRYAICLVKEQGKYGRSLGLSYPGPLDAERALREGRIDRETYQAVCLAHQQNRRPPWGSPLGGEIYIHEGGSASDWTQGCIALNTADMDGLFPYWQQIESVEILP